EKMDRKVRGGEPHLPVEVGRQSEGDGGVGEGREDAPVNRPRAVTDLFAVRQLQHGTVQGDLLQNGMEPADRRRAREPPPEACEQVRSELARTTPVWLRRRRAHKRFILLGIGRPERRSWTTAQLRTC